MTEPTDPQDDLIEMLTAPGLTFIQVMHDSDCPGANGDPANCVCTPEIRIHRDQEVFVQEELRSRAQRRAAERNAKRVTRKAQGKS